MKTKTILLASICVLILTACSSQPSEDAIQTAIAQTETAKPTETPLPTKTPKPTAKPTKTPTLAPTQPLAGLPGADPEIITSGLETVGFICEGPNPTKDNNYLWSCKDFTPDIDKYHSAYIMVLGSTDHTIDQIIAVAVAFKTTNSSKYTTRLFGFISTVPYENATIDETRQWVESTLADNLVVENETYIAEGRIAFNLRKDDGGYFMIIEKNNEPD